MAWADSLAFWEWNYRHYTATDRSARSCGHADPDGYPGSIRWGIGPRDRHQDRCPIECSQDTHLGRRGRKNEHCGQWQCNACNSTPKMRDCLPKPYLDKIRVIP